MESFIYKSIIGRLKNYLK